MAMRLEHAEKTASSASGGRQSASNIGDSSSSNLTARMSASSSTRSGRMDTARQRKRRCAYSRFSSSMLDSMCSYVSSKPFGKSFKMLRILAGKLRRSLSIWQTTHRNLGHHVSIMAKREVSKDANAHIPSAFSERVSITNCWSSFLHFFIFLSERIVALM